MNRYKIIIGDRQTLLREGIRTIIDPEPDLEVVATAENSEELCASIEELRPDAVIVDMALQPAGGIEITQWIKKRCPDVKVLLFAKHTDGRELVGALAAGANGVMPKDIEWDELLRQVRAALGERLYLAEPMAKLLSRELFRLLHEGRRGSSGYEWLTERYRFTDKECEISRLIARGLNNRQIAEALKYSDGTVRNYVSSIYEKIGIKDRAKAVIFLRETGFQE